jgi:tellurite resistance protein TerC
MPWWIYAAFVALVAALIVLDLCVLHRKSQSVSISAALGWTAFWICLGLAFNGVVYLLYSGAIFPRYMMDVPHASGTEAALLFFTGYLVEYSLSVDNLFVIAVIIASFRVPSEHQHRLLFWGILSAAVLRGVMILAGAALIQHFEATMYVFGALLIISALRIAFSGEDDFDPNKSIVMKTVKRVFPVTHEFHGKNFFTVENGKWIATPMFLALLLIESCDVMFAVDSIPAVFAVTEDPFLVFTSNIFAILGLRSLYFALAGLMDSFHYLKKALIILLIFVGVKMILHHHMKIPNGISLGIIVAILAAGVGASLLLPPPHAKPPQDVPPPA